MAMEGIGALAGMSAGIGTEPAARAKDSGGAFTKMVDQLLSYANKQDAQANAAVENLTLGQTDNLHGVMLSMAQADLSFRLVLEIRNRLTEAYQEIMRMQV
jgi:flagellar hook-basal body complex protein FliE